MLKKVIIMNMDLKNLITNPLQNFFDMEIKPSDIASCNGENTVTPTTFRLPDDIRNYYQLMANASRNTLQGAVLNVLSAVMNSHIIDNPAETYANNIKNRFFHMSNFAGIPIRKIPQFLKEFNVKQEDLTSATKIVKIISDDSIVDFLAETLFFNRGSKRKPQIFPKIFK